MTVPEVPAPLVRLCALLDVHTAYQNAGGTVTEADPDALVAVVRALGVPLGGPDDRLISEVVAAEEARLDAQVLEPVLVVPPGPAVAFPLGLPHGAHPRDIWVTIGPEPSLAPPPGGETPVEGAPGAVRTRLLPLIGRPLGTSSVGGARIDRYELRLGASGPVPPPGGLAPGYYRLRLEGDGVEASALLLVAPRCPDATRGWGAFLPLHSLRTAEDWGVGDYPALARLARWIGQAGGDVVGTLPLYPTFIERFAPPSPYLPVTRLGWSELYIDPTAEPELAAAPEAADLVASAAFRQELARHRRSSLVDYPAAMDRRRRVLEPMARALFAGRSARRDQLARFAGARPELVAYARFRSAAETGTAQEARRRHPGAPSGLDDLDEGARYHLYVQWVADRQLAEAAGRLYLDLPVGVHPDGFDPWWEPEAFAPGVEGGAPPDTFFGGGQRWGFRPLHPRAIREAGYRYPIACLRHVMRHAAVLRIDHVMSLHRLFWVPDGFDVADGVYVGYRAEELRAVVALEAYRSATVVVGEDLGTVPEEVRTAMAQDHMLRSWVLQFAASPDDPVPDPPELAMASLGTHDLPRFAAFWEGSDLDERDARGGMAAVLSGTSASERQRRQGWRRAVNARLAASWEPGADAGSVGLVRTFLRHLAAGPARQVLVDLEDLWGERRPQNRPGTGVEALNWQHRAAKTLEAMVADRELVAILRDVDERRRQPAETPEPETPEPPGRRRGLGTIRSVGEPATAGGPLAPSVAVPGTTALPRQVALPHRPQPPEPERPEPPEPPRRSLRPEGPSAP